MLKIICCNNNDAETLAKVFAIRTEVFVKEQGVDPNLELDEHDVTAHHYLVLDNEQAIATARWRETEKGIKLERFAVLFQYRNKGIGDVLLKEVLQDVLALQKIIYLHAQLKAVSFYARNGFVKQGKIFTEAGIEHYKMIYT